MAGENQKVHWQVEVGGQIYEAVLAELPEWINEGSLLPDDKIRKGNLRWIEARKVPALIPFFNAKEKGEPLPIVQTYTEANSEDNVRQDREPNGGNTVQVTSAQPIQVSPPQTVIKNLPTLAAKASVGGDICIVHVETPSFYLCGSCGDAFCKACPKSFGGEVRICPNCDSLCRPISEVAESNKRASVVAVSTNEGFGAGDFFRALAYPFKFKASLIFGGLMFMFFKLGQSASAIGGIFMIAAAIVCVLLANMLTFGVLANTVENFTQGRLEADFMPGFDDFSTWDDVVHPFLLSIGVYISSFGAFILVMIVGLYFILNAANAQVKMFKEEISRVPGTQYYQPDRTMEQSEEVKNLLDKVKLQNERRLDQQKQVEAGNNITTTNANNDDAGKVNEETKANQLNFVAGQNAPDQEQQYARMFSGTLGLAAPLVILGAITFLWGIFYFPAACAVAGYSRSFMATVNPMVGIDTIRRLGFSYVKILLMWVCILIATIIVSYLLQLVFSPLNLPQFGNIPAKAIGSFFGFYFSVVFSCVLGFALFKAADRLKLSR